MPTASRTIIVPGRHTVDLSTASAAHPVKRPPLPKTTAKPSLKGG